MRHNSIIWIYIHECYQWIPPMLWRPGTKKHSYNECNLQTTAITSWHKPVITVDECALSHCQFVQMKKRRWCLPSDYPETSTAIKPSEPVSWANKWCHPLYHTIWTDDFLAVCPALRILQLNVLGLSAAWFSIISNRADRQNVNIICLTWPNQHRQRLHDSDEDKVLRLELVAFTKWNEIK